MKSINFEYRIFCYFCLERGSPNSNFEVCSLALPKMGGSSEMQNVSVKLTDEEEHGEGEESATNVIATGNVPRSVASPCDM